MKIMKKKQPWTTWTPLALALLAPSCRGAQGVAPATVFRHVSVLPMTADTVLRDQAVVVENGVITWVGPSASAPVPAGALVIEGGGRFLLPGLADMHVHMEGADVPLFLANGVLEVRELNGAQFHVALRDSIEKGLRPGPRMFISSPLLAGVPQRWRHELVETPEAARRAAREAKEAGYDALKVYDGLTRDTYEALVVAGRELGLPLVGHIPADVGLDGVLAAGQRSIEHTEQIMYATVGHAPDPAQIPGIVAKIAATDTWVVPTLAAQRILTQARTQAYNARLEAPEMRFVDSGTLGWWRSLAMPEGTASPPANDPRRVRAEAFYGFQKELARALYAAGVPFLVGTDTPNPLLVPGYSLHLELAALVDAGIPTYDVLRAATAEAARFVGEGGRWGQVSVGAAADLVLSDANPLDGIETLRDPAGVMVRGRWIDRPALARMIEPLRRSE
jgi:imidazolonepropionase-like amidohydrolase